MTDDEMVQLNALAAHLIGRRFPGAYLLAKAVDEIERLRMEIATHGDALSIAREWEKTWENLSKEQGAELARLRAELEREAR